jgi:hypothetical protein
MAQAARRLSKLVPPEPGESFGDRVSIPFVPRSGTKADEDADETAEEEEDGIEVGARWQSR